MQAILVMEDGSVIKGKAFGATGQSNGEVVFNTGMTGYQELLTDPSYCGQIVVMTYPLVGNCGINKDDFESQHCHVRGLIVREVCDKPSNWRSSSELHEYLSREGVIGLSGIDTRALTKKIRQHGTMRGVIVTGEADVQQLLKQVQDVPSLDEQQLVPLVATKEAYTIQGPGQRVVIIDLGVKQSIIRSLNKRGCEVVVVPPTSDAETIKSYQPAAILLSNGPGNPRNVPQVLDTVKALLGTLPIFGICLGHQVISLALGGQTNKMKFGHRGVNQPVKDLRTGRVYITSQNHAYVVEGDSLPENVAVTHINVNDGTVEGLQHKELPVYSVQFHPEAAPGPEDTAYLFDEFVELIERNNKQ